MSKRVNKKEISQAQTEVKPTYEEWSKNEEPVETTVDETPANETQNITEHKQEVVAVQEEKKSIIDFDYDSYYQWAKEKTLKDSEILDICKYLYVFAKKQSNVTVETTIEKLLKQLNREFYRFDNKPKKFNKPKRFDNDDRNDGDEDDNNRDNHNRDNYKNRNNGNRDDNRGKGRGRGKFRNNYDDNNGNNNTNSNNDNDNDDFRNKSRDYSNDSFRNRSRTRNENSPYVPSDKKYNNSK